MGNSSNRPKYGPGNTVVGEPIFLPDDAFPAVDPDFSKRDTAALSLASFAGPPAGSPVPPTAAAEATTGEADGYGYGYQPNVSTPYPSAPVTLAPYPSAYGPNAPGVVPPPPVAQTMRPRRREGGPSLLAIAAISFVVIGGLTTGGFLVARSAGTSDDNDKPIVAGSATEVPVATVPIEDPNSVAGPIPSETAKPIVRKPVYTGPVSTGRGRYGPKPRNGLSPTPINPPLPPAATATATAAPDPAPAPTATQPTPAPDPAPTSSGRHRRGG